MDRRPLGLAAGREIAAAARAFDYDRYLAALLASERDQASLLVLLAFAAEVSVVPDKVSEPRLGQIRLQWWRDALVAPKGARSGHPLADDLREVMAARGIAAPLLIGFVDACEFLLERRPMPDAAHLKAYLIKTEATLFAAGAQVLGGGEGSMDALSESAGLALGRARLVLGFGRDLARGRLILPLPDALRARLEAADLQDENVRHDIDTVLQAEAEEACASARRAIEQAGGIAARARTAFLPVATVEGDMVRWRRLRPDPLREQVRPRRLAHWWRIWRLHRRWGRAS